MTDLSAILAKADALLAQTKIVQALALLDDARKAAPQQPALYVKMAELFEKLGQIPAATRLYEEALAHAPENQDLLQAAATFLYKTDQCAKGYAATRPLSQKPDCPPTLRLLHAHLAKGAGHNDEAIAIYEKVLASDPHNVIALNSLGTTALDEGDKTKAIAYLEKALALAPHEAMIAMHLAHAYFRRGLAGDMQKGWQHYAARFKAVATPRPFLQRNWQGQKLDQDTLLLWAEQGLGEEILYAGLLPEARGAAPHLIVECDTRLLPLFSRSFAGVTFVARTDPPAKSATLATWQAPLAQLGALLRKSFSDFPPAKAYLKADLEKQEHLRKKYTSLKNEKKLSGHIIGISWKSQRLRHGDPKSTHLEMWERIFKSSPHLFINLQDGDSTAEQELANANGWNLFSDTGINQRTVVDDYAAQIAALDAVITVSNSTAHLAGALGVPTYVLLPQSRGLMWHWFEDTDTAPWYPHVKLLRQTVDGDWQPPLDIVSNYL